MKEVLKLSEKESVVFLDILKNIRNEFEESKIKKMKLRN